MDLILNTFGTSLQKENDNFLIVHPDGKQVVSPDKIRSISISKGALISSDAALLAVNNEIDVMFVDNAGKPVGRLWSVKYGSVSTIRRNQLDFTLSAKAVDWIKDIITQKINNQIALLLTYTFQGDENQKLIDKSIGRLEDYRNKVENLKGEVVSDIAATLRGWEGVATKIYFEMISAMLPEKYRFESRSQHPATDILNCLLNYGYGILYGKIEGALIKAGIDPYVGVFHRDDYNRPVLVFDVIEIFRVWVDYVVINLCMQEAIGEECYSVRDDGSYWLEALGKRILIQSLNDYLSEEVRMNGIDRTRLTHINLYAQNLAQKFLNFKE